MNTRFRKNLSGRMSFYSYIPCRMQEYDIICDDKLKIQIEKLWQLSDELNKKIACSDKQVIDDLIAAEAHDSWRIASDKTEFSFVISYSPNNNENEVNIKRAITYAVDTLTELPLSSRLFCNMHYIVCDSSEYDKKYRGEYRTSPVWIGKQGCRISDASFVPPVGEDMTEAITDLENFIHYSDYDTFVKAALIHYQFEMIHPFIDANGRMGRLLNNLFLFENEVLSYPTLLLSHIISRSYNEYCQSIQQVNITGDISAWIKLWLDYLINSMGYTLQTINNKMTYDKGIVF